MSNRLKVCLVEFTGQPQNLALACGLDPVQPIRQYQLTPDGSNFYPCYEGDEKISEKNWGTYLMQGIDGAPPPPYISPEIDDGKLYLSDVWVLGAPKEKLHVKILLFNKSGA